MTSSELSVPSVLTSALFLSAFGYTPELEKMFFCQLRTFFIRLNQTFFQGFKHFLLCIGQRFIKINLFGKQLSMLSLNTVMLPIALYLIYVMLRWLWEIGAIQGVCNGIDSLFTHIAEWWYRLEPHERQGSQSTTHSMNIHEITIGIINFGYFPIALFVTIP